MGLQTGVHTPCRQPDLMSKDDPDSNHCKTKHGQVLMPHCVPSTVFNMKSSFL